MKKSKQCPKCDSLRIGFIEVQPDVENLVAADGGPAMRGTAVPARVVGVGKVVDSGWYNWGQISPLIGTLEAYVCADCGYHESYVSEPQSVDWDSIRKFSWVNADPARDTPFR